MGDPHSKNSHRRPTPLPSTAPLLLPLPPSSNQCRLCRTTDPPQSSLNDSAHPFPSAISCLYPAILPLFLVFLFTAELRYSTCRQMESGFKTQRLSSSMIHFKLAARSHLRASLCQMSAPSTMEISFTCFAFKCNHYTALITRLYTRRRTNVPLQRPLLLLARVKGTQPRG